MYSVILKGFSMPKDSMMLEYRMLLPLVCQEEVMSSVPAAHLPPPQPQPSLVRKQGRDFASPVLEQPLALMTEVVSEEPNSCVIPLEALGYLLVGRQNPNPRAECARLALGKKGAHELVTNL